VRVGALEFRELQENWTVFLAASDRRSGGFDPVESLRCTGALISAVGRIIATADATEAPDDVVPVP
jgi:hypothetical protein